MISTGSVDLIVGVMSAADPKKQKAAFERLQALDVGNGGEPPVAPSSFRDNSLVSETALHATPSRLPERHDKRSVARSFEAVFLELALKDMLPDSPSLYGDEFSGGMWKSLLAQQLGEHIAKSGGIGLQAFLFPEKS